MAAVNANASHIAISVPDAEKAVDWYTKVLGLHVLVPLRTPKSKQEMDSQVDRMYGQESDTFKLAILGSRNGVGLQIFEFVPARYNGPEERPTYGPNSYTKGGFFHVCFTLPKPDKTAAIAAEEGGSRIREK